MEEVAKRYTTAQVAAIGLVTLVAGAAVTYLLVKAMQAGPGDPPVKVRGGAMTFRTKSGQFQQVGTSNSYCIVLADPGKTVSLDLFQPGNHTTTPKPQLTLADQMQIDFLGRNEKGKAKKNGNGIHVLITSSCNGKPGVSATFSPLGNSAFYLNQKDAASQDGDDDPTNPDTSSSLRFQDLDCAANFPPTPIPGGPVQNPNGDEDLCENMGAINVTPAPTNGNPWVRCHNGDCSVEFNVQ